MWYQMCGQEWIQQLGKDRNCSAACAVVDAGDSRTTALCPESRAVPKTTVVPKDGIALHWKKLVQQGTYGSKQGKNPGSFIISLLYVKNTS